MSEPHQHGTALPRPLGRREAVVLSLVGFAGFFGLWLAVASSGLVDPRLLMDRSLTLTGGDLWNVLTSAPIRRERAVALFAQIRAGQLRPDIAARFALSDGAKAHAYLESREAIGKVLLTL